MSFTASDVAALRAETGAGIMECKKALTETGGDKTKALAWLREQGVLKAAKKADRIAANGIVESYIHMGGKIGVLVEVNCETDFVARAENFKNLVHDIAMHIAAANPKYVRIEDVQASDIESEREVLVKQAINEGKPVEIAQKMVEGRIKKFYKEICLLEQDFVKNSEITVGRLVTEAIHVIGEKITVRRFVRFECGEGIEKRVDNLAEEVAKQLGNA